MTPKQLTALPLGTHPIKQHPGLRLEVRASKRTWTLRRRDEAGKLKQQVLGHYPELSLAGAIAACEEARRAKPKARGPEPKAVTVRAVIHRYVLDHIRTRRKDWKHSEALIWRHAEAIGDDDAGGVTRASAYAFLSKVSDRPAIQRVMKMELSAAWEHAMMAGLLDDGVNPWARIKVAPPSKKDRVLTDAEVRTLWKWLDGGITPTPRDALRLTLATGARSGEVIAMRWADIDMARGEWRLPTSKNGLGRTVYLNAVALAVLASRAVDGEFVFPTQRQQMISNAVYAAHGQCPISGWTPHDLRRTMRTGLARLGISHEVAELCLGHALGGVAGVYNLYQYGEEQRDALQKWGAHLRTLTA